MNAYIFTEKNPNYSIYNAVVLASSEAEAWSFIAAEWNNEMGEVKEKLEIVAVKPLNAGVLDVVWYVE